MRTCLETAKLERLDERLSTLESNEYVNIPLRSTGAQTFRDWRAAVAASPLRSSQTSRGRLPTG